MWQVNQYRDFTGGENRRVVSELIAPNQVQLARNCIITPEGALESRYGKVKVNTAALPAGIRAMWRWSKSNGTKYLTVVAGKYVYSVTWDGSTPVASFGTAVKTLTSATSAIRGVVWKDHLILSDGVDNPFRFDGTTCTDLAGSPPKFNIFCVHAAKLCAVDIANPSQIRFSGLEDYDTWNALDVYNVRSNDADAITALDSQQNGLLICKRNSSWGLFGFDRYDFQMSTGPISPVGALNQDSVQNGLFMGRDNFYIASLPNIQPMPDTHGITVQRYDSTTHVRSCYSQKDAFALIAAGGDVYCLNAKFGGVITTWDSLNVGALAYAEDTGCILVADADDGHVYCLSGNDDDGTVYYTDIITPYLDMGMVRDKVFRNIHHRFQILNGGHDLLVRADVDFASRVRFSTTQFLTLNPLEWGIDSWGVSDWAAASDARSDYVHWLHGQRGQYVSVGFKTASRVKFLGYTVKFKEVGNLI
jgi:hypothetical protein